MKLAIFGDSYAKTFDNHKDCETLGPAWWEILADSYSVDNYGHAGSAAYYSIEKFNEYHHLYDRIIFVMTFPGRVYLGQNNRIVTEDYPRNIDTNFNSYDSAAINLKLLQGLNNYNKLDEIKIQAVMDYFLYVCNLDEENFKIKVYSDYVKQTRPDCLLVSSNTLFGASKLEFDHWGISGDILNDYLEIRKCHFSNENNVILSNIYNDWIKTDTFDFNENKFVKPQLSWQQYFKKYST